VTLALFALLAVQINRHLKSTHRSGESPVVTHNSRFRVFMDLVPHPWRRM
jgi:hypothetical protein